MKLITLTITFLNILLIAQAQDYIKDGKNRYTFAQTTIGYNIDFTPPSGYSYYSKNGAIEKFNFGSSITPVFTITGLHFWGHAEFFTGFALPTINLDKNSSYSFSRSAGTGFKFFPLQIREKHLTPFFGSAVSSFAYKLGEAVKFKRIEFPVNFGLTYSFKHGLIELGVNYYHANSYQYYLSKQEAFKLSTPPLAFSLDYKYFFDFTKSSHKKDLAGETERKYEKLKKSKHLSGFSIAAGPAYSFFVGNSSYNNQVRPYLDQYKISEIFPDLGLGYYFYQLDGSINLSYRSFDAELEAFDVHQSVDRKSIALEVFKFFGDYHGFVPFVGPTISREFTRVIEIENRNVVLDKIHSFWSPGIILGWDVRPTRVDWWGVRTNIRYFPLLQLSVSSNYEIDFQQIEVNFLQLVIYPNRLQGHFTKE